MTLADLLWDKAEPALYCTKEEWLKTLEGFELKPVVIEGELSFITAQKGPVFHFHSLGTKRQISLKMIRDFLRPIIAAHGYAETRTPHEDERQHRFNRAFGFKEVGRDAFDAIYRIERVR